MIMKFSSHVLLSLALLISLVRLSSGQGNGNNGNGNNGNGNNGNGNNGNNDNGNNGNGNNGNIGNGNGNNGNGNGNGGSNQDVCPADCVDSIDALAELLNDTIDAQTILETRITNAEGDISDLQTDVQDLDDRLDALEEDDCELLFSAKAGTGENVFQTWQAAASVGTGPGADIFKSPEVENWDTRGVYLVKVKVLTAGVVQAYFIFDGRYTTKNNFMSPANLLASSSGSLASESFLFFSVEGDAASKRRFFIQKSYGGCPNDFGWLVVVDGDNAAPCPWEANADIPYFIYCDEETDACNENTAPIGDQFTICAKFLH